MDGHVPAGTSVRTAAQFAQNYNSGMTKFILLLTIEINTVYRQVCKTPFLCLTYKGETFIPYSYGWLRNLQLYNGRLTPPPYELNKVTCPVYIFYGYYIVIRFIF
jgi:hypothetical protein